MINGAIMVRTEKLLHFNATKFNTTLFNMRKNSPPARRNMNKAEINSLLLDISNGDNKAFEKLYIKTSRGVFAFIYTYLHDYHESQDAMQTVYLKIKKGITSYVPGSNGSAWILQIAKNHALNVIKARRQTVDIDGIAHKLSGEEMVYSDQSSVMQVMRTHLNDEEQQIVTLHVLWGYKHREIAKMLNCPTGTITSKYKRALQKIKNNLKEDNT